MRGEEDSDDESVAGESGRELAHSFSRSQGKSQKDAHGGANQHHRTPTAVKGGVGFMGDTDIDPDDIPKLSKNLKRTRRALESDGIFVLTHSHIPPHTCVFQMTTFRSSCRRREKGEKS